MKKLLLALTVAMISASVMAQTENNKAATSDTASKAHQHRRHKAPEKLSRLNLTEEQNQQMKTLNLTLREKMRDLKQKDNITVKEQKEQKLAIIKQHQADLNKLLTDEQKAKLQQTKKKRFDKGVVSSKHDGKSRKQLNLTDEQRSKLKVLSSTYKTKIAAIQKNSSLSDEQKATQLKAFHQQRKEEMNTLLTQEQKELLKHSRKNRKEQKAA